MEAFNISVMRIAAKGLKLLKKLLNPLPAKDKYIRPPCTLHTTTVHAFRVHQEHIYLSLAVGKKSLVTQRVNAVTLD